MHLQRWAEGTLHLWAGRILHAAPRCAKPFKDYRLYDHLGLFSISMILESTFLGISFYGQPHRCGCDTCQVDLTIFLNRQTDVPALKELVDYRVGETERCRKKIMSMPTSLSAESRWKALRASGAVAFFAWNLLVSLLFLHLDHLGTGTEMG